MSTRKFESNNSKIHKKKKVETLIASQKEVMNKLIKNKTRKMN